MYWLYTYRISVTSASKAKTFSTYHFLVDLATDCYSDRVLIHYGALMDHGACELHMECKWTCHIIR